MPEKVDSGEESGEGGFEQLGLDNPRLVRALSSKNISNPTPIQSAAVPLILAGKDVAVQAKTGSGKTYAYLLPLIHRLITNAAADKSAPSAFILLPTRELCQQVYSVVKSLSKLCEFHLKVVQLTSGMPVPELTAALGGLPDILVSTPGCVSTCITENLLQSASILDSLSFLILDEADLLLSYGYEDDLKAFVPHVSRSCQCLLMSATLSADVEKLKNLVLRSPYIVTLPESENAKDEIIPKSVQQFWISCSARDKLLNLLAILKLELVQKKVLIYVNTIDMGYRIKLFLEKFGIRSSVLNSELPQNSRLHTIEEFNAGLFDYLIAVDCGKLKENEQTGSESVLGSKKSGKHVKPYSNSEFKLVKAIDFKRVYTVINFELPQSTEGYLLRIGRTGRNHTTGASISLVAPDEEKILCEIKSLFEGSDDEHSSHFMAPFPLLTKSAVESLRYRAEDISQSVTKIAVKKSRAQDLKNEILNSDKLKAHFQENPRDLDLLKRTKVMRKKPAPSHLRTVPDYLVDPTTNEASKIVKLARAAMGNMGPSHRGTKRKIDRRKDPINTSSAEPEKEGEKKWKNKGGGHYKRRKKTRN